MPGALGFHRRTCQKAKKRLSGAITMAKELWQGRKKRRVETTVGGSGDSSREVRSEDAPVGVAVMDSAEVRGLSP